jgi:aminoglycoside 3-N-acetyltransferase
VIIHSSLFHFGRFDGGVQRFSRMIDDVFDETYTIVMPAFNWQFTTTHYWNYHTTKSQSGILTEYTRTRPGTCRTIHPFHSVTARGADQSMFTGTMSLSSFGPGSAFERLYQRNAFNLSLGSPFVGGATFCHYTEELLAVPYRYYKPFEGEVVDAASRPVEATFSMFVRVIESDHEFVNTWDVLWSDLLAHRLVRYEQYNGFAPILLMSVRDVHDFLGERISRDPYYVAKRIPRAGQTT